MYQTDNHTTREFNRKMFEACVRRGKSTTQKANRERTYPGTLAVITMRSMRSRPPCNSFGLCIVSSRECCLFVRFVKETRTSWVISDVDGNADA